MTKWEARSHLHKTAIPVAVQFGSISFKLGGVLANDHSPEIERQGIA